MSLYQPAADFILLLLLISHVNSDYDRAPLFRSNQNQQDFQCQGPQLCVRRPITFSDPAARRTALQHPSSFPTSTLTSGGRCQYRRGQLSVRLPLSPAASSLDRPCTQYLHLPAHSRTLQSRNASSPYVDATLSKPQLFTLQISEGCNGAAIRSSMAQPVSLLLPLQLPGTTTGTSQSRSQSSSLL